MTPEEITQALDGYDRITEAAEKALDADRTLIDEGDRWLPRPYASDLKFLYLSDDTGNLRGEASVWTNQTGGSNESMGFSIPLDTLNKYL